MLEPKDVLDISIKVLKATNPLLWGVIELTEKAIKKSTDAAQNGDIEEMTQEALRQEFILKMAEAQAKVAQEVSIARRIDTAEEVKIEEFYESGGEGSLGASLKEEGVTVGLSGSGRRIAKRVYTFKGWRDGGLDIFNKMAEEHEKE